MEDNRKDEHITEKTVDFIIWYKNLSTDEKEFASALMIGNFTDEQLVQIKEKTIHNYPLFTGIMDRTN